MACVEFPVRLLLLPLLLEVVFGSIYTCLRTLLFYKCIIPNVCFVVEFRISCRQVVLRIYLVAATGVRNDIIRHANILLTLINLSHAF